MAKEKVKIDIPGSLFPFIPPVSELIGWLGGPKELHTQLYRMQKEHQQHKPDLKTLRKACHDGVTPRSAAMIKANIYEAAEGMGFNELIKGTTPVEPLVNGTNGATWSAQASGFLNGINRHQTEKLKLPRTFAFLEKRAQAESKMMLALQNDAPNEERLVLLHTAFCEACQHYTLLSPQQIQSYGIVIIDANWTGHTRTLKQVAEALKCSFSLRVDFYHQLLANFMADMLPLRKSLRLSTSLDDALVNHGAMGRMLPLRRQGKLITPTERVYAYWRRAFLDVGEKPVTNSAMALHMPLPALPKTRVKQSPSTESSADTLQKITDAANDSRLSLWKQWRRGAIPESEHLTKFLESLSSEAYDAFLPFVMTRVATAWTKWIEYECAKLQGLMQQAPSLAELINMEWLVNKFSEYPKYWEHMAQVTTDHPEP